jgi:hypothetical protein
MTSQNNFKQAGDSKQYTRTRVILSSKWMKRIKFVIIEKFTIIINNKLRCRTRKTKKLICTCRWANEYSKGSTEKCLISNCNRSKSFKCMEIWQKLRSKSIERSLMLTKFLITNSMPLFQDFLMQNILAVQLDQKQS